MLIERQPIRDSQGVSGMHSFVTYKSSEQAVDRLWQLFMTSKIQSGHFWSHIHIYGYNQTLNPAVCTHKVIKAFKK